MNSEPLSKTCPKCGARFLNGRLYWATGKPGDPRDLAGLVCKRFGDSTCINPMKNAEGGDTWEKREEFTRIITRELNRGVEEMDS